MADIKEVFADGLNTIHILNRTVRLDFFTLQPLQNQSKPTPNVHERIIMPIQTFLDMYDVMQQIVDKLIKDGIIISKEQKINEWNIQR